MPKQLKPYPHKPATMSSKHSLMPPLNAPLLLDFSKLKELSDGDAEFEKQILSLIIEQSKETVTEIHQSVTNVSSLSSYDIWD